MQDKKALTLLELLIVVAIIGLLAAVLVPNLLGARKNAQYTAATLLLNDLAQQLMTCLVETGEFPADVAPGVAPSGCPDLVWPSANEIPFGSTLDYENWSVSGGRWVGLTFWGEANKRSGHSSGTDLGPGLRRFVTADNINIVLGLETP